MAKWEYVYVVAADDEWNLSLIHPAYDEAEHSRNGVGLWRLLAKLGDDGWELVSVNQNRYEQRDRVFTEYYFKRPRS